MPTFSGFFALFATVHDNAGRTLSRLCLPHPAGGVQTPWCLCTSTSDAGISAPRWAQIGNVCVSFHAVSIHTEKVPRLPVVLPRRPHADIGTCSIRRCDGQTLDIACRQEIRNNHDYSGIGNCPSQRRILEPVSGIEPEYSAWKADVLPLNYTGTLPPRHAPGRDIREEKGGI